MIKKIGKIDNFGVFTDFDWDKEVLNKKNEIEVFKKINIIYGRNYSGKTTLSRILRGMETGKLSDKFEKPSFSVTVVKNVTTNNNQTTEDKKEITQDSLQDHDRVVRVFNDDFIRENLRFINNPEEGIEPFAIFGANNNKIEEEIATIEAELGSKQDGMETGLHANHIQLTVVWQQANQNLTGAINDLDALLRKKATDKEIGIKYKPERFGDQNYDITKLKKEINTVQEPTYSPPTEMQLAEYEKKTKETYLPPIHSLDVPKLQFDHLVRKSRDLVEREISVSNKINELVKNAVLNRWVKEGREHHRGKRTSCAFCGNLITEGRWEELDRHFDETSESFDNDINLAINEIEIEKDLIKKVLMIDRSKFYSCCYSQLDELEKKLSESIAAYNGTLVSLEIQLKNRKEDLLHPKVFVNPGDCSANLNQAWSEYEAICRNSNSYASNLTTEKHKAQKELRLAEVYKFLSEIDYQNRMSKIDEYKEKKENSEQRKNESERVICEKEALVDIKKRELSSEEEGAKKVNEYLNNFFGYCFLTLRAQKSELVNEDNKQVRFEIIRDGKKAYHLSEGECSLLAFCYFLAKLDDVNTHDGNPTIWIDDPISSLDSNHIFFIYSLIKTKIIETKRFEQLFISTHNLDFLKYLKRLVYKNNEKNVCYFIIIRNDRKSTINLMPDYLKEFVTEFNYLFHQIYKCAHINAVNDSNYTTFYNFGNDARKFLEIYLYYKYPDNRGPMEKLTQFFGEDKVPAVLANRINNEYSHMCAIFERGSVPIEVPEMKKVAQKILDVLKKDKEQYKSLLKSIGVEQGGE